VNVNLNTTRQTIRGYGGMNFPRWIGTLTDAQVDKAFGNGDGQIGLTIMRIDVPPDSGDWSGELSAAQRAISNGAIVFATPWSPPASMKSNGSTIGGSLNSSSYGAYANHLRDFANYMSSNGASLYAISVQNEPDYLPDYESCGWTSSQMRTFLDNNASVIPVKVIAPETVSPKSDWYNALSSASQLDIYGDHLYGGSPTSFSKEHWMTEHYTNTNNANNWPDALGVSQEIHNCMTNNYSAYIWWYVRRSYGPLDENGNITKRGYVMSHYAKFVRPGYVRVDATASPQSNVYTTAYKSGNTLVIIATNRNSSSISLTFSLSGGSVSNYTKYETTSSNNVSNRGSVGSSDTLAGNSINTYVGTIGGGGSTPGQASNPSPANGATNVGTTTDLSWTAGSGATYHDVYFGTANPPPQVSSGQAGTTYDTGTMSNSTTYYWRIDEKNDYGTTTGTVWSFTTTEGGGSAVNLLGSWVTGTSHTKESGTDRALIFIAHAESTSTINLSAVTYGGQSMTKVVDYSYNAASGYAYAAAFILKESGVAAASSSTFSVTWGGTAPGSMGYSSAFFSNVDQTTSTGATGTGGSTSNPVTTSALATSDGDMVILGATCGNSGSYTLNNSFIEGNDQQINGTVTGVTGYKSATGANETPSATYSSTINRQMIIGLVVNAAAGGGPTDTTPPTPDPMTWASFPTAAGQTTIAMTATTATDSESPPVQYYFECTNDGTKSSGWQSSSSYTATGLTPATQYSFRVRARDSASTPNVTGWSSTQYATTESPTPDTTPPTPDPMTWASVPVATGQTTIAMTATTATDSESPPVQYYFECTNDGTKSSSWQSSSSYTASGLNPGTQYSFRVKARDSASTPNETGWSSTQSATTQEAGEEIEILGSWLTGTSHTKESGSNRALIFLAHGERSGTMNLSAVTYGGQSMTKIMDYNYNRSRGYAYAAAFILKEAGVAAASGNTFTVTWSGTAPSEVGYSSVFLGNVNQTTATGATGSGGSGSNPVTTSALATSSGDMVILAATCGNRGSYTLNNNFIEGTDQQMASSTSVTGHKSATGANETPSATYSSTINRQMIIGFVVKHQ
jgi:glucuronoarabinoxylan endo-1,4-beta-xylanase